MSGLREALAALGKQPPEGPPPSVKYAVMAEFRRRRRRRATSKWLVLAAAAAILLAVFVARRPQPKIVPKATTRIVVPVETAPHQGGAGASACLGCLRPKLAASSPVRRRRAVKPSAPPQMDETPEVATDFFAIPYTEPLRPDERADVFRVEMPRANVAAFGLPLSGGHLDAPITADVLVGEDGVMRAIRFVR